MSTVEQQPEESSGRSPDAPLREERKPDYAQYMVVAVLAIVGGFLVYSAMTLPDGFANVDPVGPEFFPMVIGIAALGLALVLAIAIPRGSVGEADAGEDIDPEAPSDWRTVGLLVAIFIAMILLVNPLGWVITSTLFFAGAATILGSNHYVRNFLIGLVLVLTSFYAFYSGLGIPLPAGILDGILLLGTAVGVLPGIGPAMTVALLLPITYNVSPSAAFIMFAGIFYGGMYGGSTTSILLNTPGSRLR